MATVSSASLWRRVFPSAARTLIMGWVLLFVMAALGIATFVTWLLLVSVIDERMDAALRISVEEFEKVKASGVSWRTGEPFASVEEVISEAIEYNIARPNEEFLGYVDGQFYTESIGQDETPDVLAKDERFAELVGSVTEPVEGLYNHREVGEVRYFADPVVMDGDPSEGVIVAAFFGKAEHAKTDHAALLMLQVGAVTTVGATLAAWLLAGRILRPLRHIADTARGITDSDLSQRIPTRDNGQGDELDDLARTVNCMLDRVEAGVSAQRRFIDDAGHELRTPITIVRGHLEVLDHNDPADIDATVALVDDELMRMNRMVSDLLVLARSEQPSFVDTRPVDIAALTKEVFTKVTRLGERNFTLQSVAEVTEICDPQRITQAMVALTDNACHYQGRGHGHHRFGTGGSMVAVLGVRLRTRC